MRTPFHSHIHHYSLLRPSPPLLTKPAQTAESPLSVILIHHTPLRCSEKLSSQRSIVIFASKQGASEKFAIMASNVKSIKRYKKKFKFYVNKLNLPREGRQRMPRKSKSHHKYSTTTVFFCSKLEIFSPSPQPIDHKVTFRSVRYHIIMRPARKFRAN